MSMQDDINEENLRKKWEEIISLKCSFNCVTPYILQSATEMKLMPDYETYIDQEIKDDIDNIISVTTGLSL